MNVRFAAFIHAASYGTVAGQAHDPKLLWKDPRERLVPGTILFSRPAGDIEGLRLLSRWRHRPDANWMHPGGSARSIAGLDDPSVVHACLRVALAGAPGGRAATHRGRVGMGHLENHGREGRYMGRWTPPGRSVGDRFLARPFLRPEYGDRRQPEDGPPTDRKRPAASPHATWPAMSGSGVPTGTGPNVHASAPACDRTGGRGMEATDNRADDIGSRRLRPASGRDAPQAGKQIPYPGPEFSRNPALRGGFVLRSREGIPLDPGGRSPSRPRPTDTEIGVIGGDTSTRFME